ncbi:MAG: c-type cytochrome [Planctomycetaceae bacterium]|nr:c-type cytochrome [Planctomycetaceae bacterium]
MSGTRSSSVCVLVLICLFPAGPLHATKLFAQKEEQIPHNQSKPPGPALTPQQAIQKMQVPDGFHVEVVASEPDIVNPVAMTFDERGRVWVTESLEYPRSSPGEGRDRVRILEDTNGDGRMDKFTVFADGLNIPSGIAVGYGGVWVANAPDLLFLQDTDGDDKADTSEVVVTGFGRFDTHELPNSLTWGPDGWLYGLNGVFNRSVVQDPVTGRTFDFTCALFRINPRTRQFELFAEGTSNPWGVAWNPSGEAFVSACVIDHLWHLTETGYYHRQGGPYPPFTWKAESIVSHKHQKAAYCGIHYFDSDAYPPEYRDRLMMGNIHGNCINVDVLQDRDSTYIVTPADDFLTANDVWFMPVVQKTGPDGCLWVLDWYDRYHCYQDARRDPEGIDRLKGRLYRVRYGDSPRAGRFDLSKESDEQLIRRLSSPNVLFRDLAQRLLSERATPESRRQLQSLVLEDQTQIRFRLHALWALIGGGPLDSSFHARLLTSSDPDLRAWGVRAAGNQHLEDAELIRQIIALQNDPHPRVRLQVAIAANKLDGVPTIPVMMNVLAQSGNDPLVPRIVWQNLHPLLEKHSNEFSRAVARIGQNNSVITELLPRAADRILSVEKPDTRTVARFVDLLLRQPGAEDAGKRCLRLLAERIQSGEIRGAVRDEVSQAIRSSVLQAATHDTDHPLALAAVELGAALGIDSLPDLAAELASAAEDSVTRASMVNALISGGDARSFDLAVALLDQAATPADARRAVQMLGRLDTDRASSVLLDRLPRLSGEVQPAVVETLTDRVDSSRQLLKQIAAKQMSPSVINANQARKMLQLGNDELNQLLKDHWGIVRSDRDPGRARLISQMRNLARTQQGDPVAGQAVFKRVCGQCHRIYGEGAEVGPDITRNGRASFEQLLSNMFDPSLVIGAAYQASTVLTTDGRIVTGLVAEDSPQRIVLKVQGDKQEVIARRDIDEVVRSPLSLMPEGLEKQITPSEMADLLAFVTLDRPPQHPDAAPLPGVRLETAESMDATKFNQLSQQLLPTLQVQKSGERGVALIENHRGRPAVRIHPVSRREAGVLAGTFTIPSTKKPVLLISVASHEQGDWQLQVRVNGKTIHESLIVRNPDSSPWQDLELSLADYSGQQVRIELLNSANDWSNEFSYWNNVEVLPE